MKELMRSPGSEYLPTLCGEPISTEEVPQYIG